MIFPTKVVCLYWGAGQSNESGSGNTLGTTGFWGLPHIDSSNGRSVIPSLAERLAKRGVLAIWCQTAFGSTSIADSWCGRIRNWVSGLYVCSGTYVLNGGVVFKCTNSLGYSGQSTTTPAAGTGADGVTWTSLGAATAEDTTVLSGTGVYPSTSTRWDPNGLLALSVNKANLVTAGINTKAALISLGQQDRLLGTTSSVFSDAMQKVALYHASNGANKVLLGMTVRSALSNDLSSANGGGVANSANTTSDNWYNTHLLPGRTAALTALSSNPAIYAGHDWATSIGSVTSQVSALSVGVKSADSVHMTDITYETSASSELDRALFASGI